MIQIAVLGYGTIGSGVAEVLKVNKESITKRVGDEISIKYILDLREFPGDPMEDKIVHDYAVIKNDPEIAIVVEAMGGVEPAYTFAKQALESGKHFATSNKALIAEKGAELIRIAKEKNVNCMFEASVGGGIPIIRPLNSCLTADVIEEVSGILNGTTNYMMTKMFYEGAGYDDVLKEAQDNGFAERNPEADVEGYDACRKIAILASIISGKQVDFEDLYCEGITKVTVEDMQYAKVMGRTVKLLATCKRHGETLSAMVSPCLLSQDHPLFSVNGVFNSVFVHGNMLGDAMFYGSGAGKLPTASAVVGDVVEAVKNIGHNLGYGWSEEKLQIQKQEEVEHRFFVRIKGKKEELQQKLEASFGMLQYVEVPEIAGEFGFVTESMKEGLYEKKVSDYTEDIISMIRVED